MQRESTHNGTNLCPPKPTSPWICVNKKQNQLNRFGRPWNSFIEMHSGAMRVHLTEVSKSSSYISARYLVPGTRTVSINCHDAVIKQSTHPQMPCVIHTSFRSFLLYAPCFDAFDEDEPFCPRCYEQQWMSNTAFAWNSKWQPPLFSQKRKRAQISIQRNNVNSANKCIRITFNAIPFNILVKGEVPMHQQSVSSVHLTTRTVTCVAINNDTTVTSRDRKTIQFAMPSKTFQFVFGARSSTEGAFGIKTMDTWWFVRAHIAGVHCMLNACKFNQEKYGVACRCLREEKCFEWAGSGQEFEINLVSVDFMPTMIDSQKQTMKFVE